MIWLVLFSLWVGSLAKRGPDGELSVMDSCTMKPYGETCSFISANFPESAPHTLYQVGRFSCFGKLSDTPSIRVHCSTLEIPKASNKECEFPLELEDESRFKPNQFCGSHSGITYMSKKSDIAIRMETGSAGGGKVNCSLSCILVDRFGKEVTTTQEPFLMDQFESEDSSEHGAAPGSLTTTCPCGQANKLTSRIINGTETLQNEYPWIAALVEREDLFPYCGAPIISARHVLTASHCVANQLIEGIELAVRVGSHDLTKDPKSGEVINVAKVIMHNDYQPTNYFKNDIALLVLEKELTFGPHVSRVCLPSSFKSPPYGSNVKIIGWGLTKPGGQIGSPVLRQVGVKLLPMDQCKLRYPRLDTVRPTQICTYRNSKGSCQGDSGGPVVWVDPDTNRYTLVGLVSFGKVCGDTNPTVHSDVSYYLTWIQGHIRRNQPSETCSKA